MSSLFTSLYTGASGIYSNQTAVQITGNNVANVNTEGYSRQIASITASASVEQGGLLFGTGSTVETIERADTSFLSKRLSSAAADYGEYEAASSPLSEIEEIFTIDETSLADDIDNFFAAWDSLNLNPGGTTERQQILSEAETLAAHLQNTSVQLGEVVDTINGSVESTIPELNDILAQIAELNTKIYLAQANSTNANTMQDQRDLLQQQVSELCGATSYLDEDGMLCLQLANGLPLVVGQLASTMSVSTVDGLTQLSLSCGNSSFALDNEAFGGSLKGSFEVRDTTIPELQNAVDRLAYELATAVNALHTTGLDQNGDAATPLFGLTAPSDPAASAWQGAASSITVLIDDPALLAAGNSGLNGDNSICLEIAALADTAAIDGSTYSEAYANITAKAGLLISSNEDRLLASLENLNAVQEERDTVSGVSADEEMLLLIQYQSGYEAAANYLSVVKEMIETLLAI